MTRIVYAHTLTGRLESDWHLLEAHLHDSACLAAGFASEFGASEWGRLAGLWHDLGKFSDAFQDYLHGSAASGGGLHAAEVVGRVDHSTAGAQHAARQARIPLGRLLAYCIAGHHAGLPDNEGGEPGLSARLLKQVESFDAAPKALLDQTLPAPPQLKLSGDASSARWGFTLAFFTRMLFSCLVDADFLDTEQFVDPARAAQRPGSPPSCAELRDRLNEYLHEKQRQAPDTHVNRVRRDVLEASWSGATLAPGLFSLNVPTGGGKTLSSLAFALSHAAEHKLRRVVYAIPFTSIIEQTADVFRAALGDLRAEVLEHHGNLPTDDPARQSERSRLAAENFDSTLIVTTNVQLFESLFAARTSRCRKLHRLAKSVIILDEAQMLPPQLLAPTLAALEELVNNYGATVVLCTATQPAIERRNKFPIGLQGVRPLIADPRSLHQALRRTSVDVWGKTTNEELVIWLRDEPQSLCIVNSRRHAADLFEALGDLDALHLSASMCAAHRSAVVGEIRRRLSAEVNAPCRVISTQVIEAGVDVDFPAVFRARAGLDSVAQASGRCNREGRLVGTAGRPVLGRVYVFDYDAKTYPTSPMIQRAADAFREVAPDHPHDLLAPEAIEAYFRLHYWQQGGDHGRGWDEGVDRQSIMQCFRTDPNVLLHAQFRTAAHAYRLIDDAQTPVLVPYGERGTELIDELERLPEMPMPCLLRAFDRKAQRYTVGVYDRGLKTLLERGVLWQRHERYYVVNRDAYDEQRGLTLDKLGPDLERLII
ncbi:MAG: CRISPR-associated endonuclease Cas3'' [Isosphaeraceae bacterium]|nr:CRISPR-associated endonuclease Cas3'' [Isosphaeraceae bacterium]